MSLMHSMAPCNDGHVNLSQFIASQVDWQDVQRNSQEEWLECARQAFRNIDKDADGLVHAQDVLDMVRQKLPLAQVGKTWQTCPIALSIFCLHIQELWIWKEKIEQSAKVVAATTGVLCPTAHMISWTGLLAAVGRGVHY